MRICWLSDYGNNGPLLPFFLALIKCPFYAGFFIRILPAFFPCLDVWSADCRSAPLAPRVTGMGGAGGVLSVICRRSSSRRLSADVYMLMLELQTLETC